MQPGLTTDGCVFQTWGRVFQTCVRTLKFKLSLECLNQPRHISPGYHILYWRFFFRTYSVWSWYFWVQEMVWKYWSTSIVFTYRTVTTLRRRTLILYPEFKVHVSGYMALQPVVVSGIVSCRDSKHWVIFKKTC